MTSAVKVKSGFKLAELDLERRLADEATYQQKLRKLQIAMLELKHRSLQLAQLLLIACLVGEPALEIELGKLKPGLDFYRRCHFTRPPCTTLRCTDFYRYP